jgi:hypothetical protein
MRKAMAYTIAALDATAEIDIDLSDDDRTFLAAEKAKLGPHHTALKETADRLTAFDEGLGLLNQVRVNIGDAVLDVGLRRGNTRTKVELQGKPGLGADHVFGSRVDIITGAKIRLEPGLVIDAIGRFDDVPAFPAKEDIKGDLRRRAEKQESLLVERDHGYTEYARIQGTAVRLVVEAADALARTKGALDNRFPRQRAYVSAFFFELGTKRQAPVSEPVPGEPPAVP